MALASQTAPRAGSPKPKAAARLVGWQGFTVRVPEDWDLTGFSGTDGSGYLRIDDSAEQGLEIKWVTEPRRAKREPDVTVRRESYFRLLRQAAKKKKLALETKEMDAPRGALRGDRSAAGFTWLGDRKAVGAVWHCRTCRRTVIAQVLGDRSGRGGLSGIAESILGSLACHGDEPGWRTWALYDLVTEAPVEFQLVSQELMNVYLRLHFEHKTSRLTVEQWSLANVARRGAFLDAWLEASTKGELRQASAEATEGEAHGHATLDLTGRPAWGLPMLNALREALRFQRPATRFQATAWECEAANKIYAVQSLRPARDADIVREIVARTRCHGEGEL